MSTPVTYTGNQYNVPAYQDTGYAQGTGNLSSYLIALATGGLTLSGGSFPLTADANFGASFGLVSIYFKSRTSNIGTAGIVRLANTDQIVWRDNAAANNLILAMNTTQTGGGTYTIPDVGVGTSASFVMTAGAQTVGGAKTFSSTLTMSGATIAMGSQKITGLAAGSTNGDALRYEQLFGGDVTLTGNLIFTPTTKGIKGTTTNDNTSTGNVGEIIFNSVSSASPITLTNNQYADVTSIILTAGDWDVSVNLGFTGGAITGTNFGGGIGTVTGNSGTGVSYGDNAIQLPTAPTAASDVGMAVPAYRISISGTATYYLKAFALFSGGTAKAYGRISARRVR